MLRVTDRLWFAIDHPNNAPERKRALATAEQQGFPLKWWLAGGALLGLLAYSGR